MPLRVLNGIPWLVCGCCTPLDEWASVQASLLYARCGLYPARPREPRLEWLLYLVRTGRVTEGIGEPIMVRRRGDYATNSTLG